MADAFYGRYNDTDDESASDSEDNTTGSGVANNRAADASTTAASR